MNSVHLNDSNSKNSIAWSLVKPHRPTHNFFKCPIVFICTSNLSRLEENLFFTYNSTTYGMIFEQSNWIPYDLKITIIGSCIFFDVPSSLAGIPPNYVSGNRSTL